MALLLSSRTPLLYPAGATPGFNPQHVCAAGLRARTGFSAVVLNNGNAIDLVSGRPPNSGLGLGVAAVHRNIGPSQATVAGTIVRAGWTGAIATPTTMTFGMIIFLTAVQGAASSNCVSTASALDDALGFALGAATPVIQQGGSTVATAGFTLALVRPYFIVASTAINAGGTGPANFVARDLLSGRIFTSVTTNATTGGNSGTAPGYGAGTRANVQMNIACAMLSYSYFKIPQLLAWAADPWAFWYPDGFDVPDIDSFIVGSARNTFSLLPDAGIYSLVGENVSLKSLRNLVPATGAFAFTGKNSSINSGRSLSSLTGFFSLTGETVKEIAARKIIPANGVFALAGESVALAAARKIATQTGFYTLTGKSVALVCALKQAAATGIYALNGQAVVLAKSGVVLFRRTLNAFGTRAGSRQTRAD